MNQERDRKIQKALQLHHDKVKEKHHVVMTVLCGSQNYGLDTITSDYDTYTFVLPTLTDMAMLKDPTSTLIEDEYGHINIKDMRLALNLLKKTTPNSVEWFATQYRIIEPEYEDLIRKYITPESLRCNTNSMMNAIGGMAHQLTKRNMPSGKRFSHMLRMECMVDNYYGMKDDILSLTKYARGLALNAKTNENYLLWDAFCLESEAHIKEKIKRFSNWNMEKVESIGNANVNNLQRELFMRYVSNALMENAFADRDVAQHGERDVLMPAT